MQFSETEDLFPLHFWFTHYADVSIDNITGVVSSDQVLLSSVGYSDRALSSFSPAYCQYGCNT